VHEKRKIEYCTGKQTEDGSNPFKSNALCCIPLCQLAYKSQPEIEKELPEYGYHGTDVAFFTSPLTRGFVIEFDNVVAVSFRGTVTKREWLNNFNIRLIRTPYGGIHAGFLHSIEQVTLMILPLVLSRLKVGRQLVVTGHSRGGALAVLFAFMVLLNGHDTNAVITFGSPMYCDAKLVRFMERFRTRMPVIRVVNKPDVVPLLPSIGPYMIFQSLLLLLGTPLTIFRLLIGISRSLYHTFIGLGQRLISAVARRF
jgi:hypothetical protein